MFVDIHLTDTTTGFSKVYHEHYDWEQFDQLYQLAVANVIHQYTEGNFACDCNRSLFLYDWDADKARPCGNTIRLDKIVDQATGRVLWNEAMQAREDEEIQVRLNLAKKFGMTFI